MTSDSTSIIIENSEQGEQYIIFVQGFDISQIYIEYICIEIPGCTDYGALNYDWGATVDNGTCNYITCENTTFGLQTTYRQRISDTEGNFTASYAKKDYFGRSLDYIGDIDGDGRGDVTVGAPLADATVNNRTLKDAGAFYNIFMNANGTAKSYKKIGADVGITQMPASKQDNVGYSIAAIGDLDGDGNEDVVVGCPGDDDGGTKPLKNSGSVVVCFLNADGSLKSMQKISNQSGGLGTILKKKDGFGSSVDVIGDLDGDGNVDIVVGAPGDDDQQVSKGSMNCAVYVLFLNSNGTIHDYQKISAVHGNFGVALDKKDYFGWSVSGMPDTDNDGLLQIAVGAIGDDDGATDAGAVYILDLDDDGEVMQSHKISKATSTEVDPLVRKGDRFGYAVHAQDDIDDDGTADLLVGQPYFDHTNNVVTGKSERDAGAYIALYMTGVVQHNAQQFAADSGLTGINITLQARYHGKDYFGSDISVIPGLDDDCHPEVIVGAFGDDDGGSDHGAFYTIYTRGLSSLPAPKMLANNDDEDAFAGRSIAQETALSADDRIETDLNLLLFPNPSNGVIKVKTDIAAAHELKVTDLFGRTLIQQNKSADSGSLSTFDLKDLASGHYLMTLTTEHKQVTKQFVLSH